MNIILPRKEQKFKNCKKIVAYKLIDKHPNCPLQKIFKKHDQIW